VPRKLTKTSDSIVCIWTEIWARGFPDMNQDIHSAETFRIWTVWPCRGHPYTVLQCYYSSRHLIACSKATEGLHPPQRAAISRQYGVASFSKLRVLSCLHSPGFRCSCCNIVPFFCDLETCNLVMANVGSFQVNWLSASEIHELSHHIPPTPGLYFT
jgi:hypothetical protein